MQLKIVLTTCIIALGASSGSALSAQIDRPSAQLPLVYAQAQRSADRDACGPGTACWRRLQDRQDDYLAERQRARQLRQFSIDNGRNMRSNGAPAYRDNEIKIFRPSDRFTVDPLRR